MPKWEDLLIMSCNDCLALPDIQNRREHQIILNFALVTWLNVLALLFSYWQDSQLRLPQLISPMTILLIVSLLILSWLTHHFFQRYYPTQIIQVHDAVEATYWRRRVLFRSGYDGVSFMLIFLIVWLIQYHKLPHFTAIPWTGLLFALIGVGISITLKYNRLITRLDFPNK